MAWYTDSNAMHYLQYGAVADRIKRQSKSQNKPGSQFPRPTQESEKERGPFQVALPRTKPPSHLTQEPNYQPVPNKKPHKNIAHTISKKKD
jgi:hypothetical protein